MDTLLIESNLFVRLMPPLVKEQTIQIPKELFAQLVTRSESLIDTYAQLEDFYFASNLDALQKLREARDQHQRGDTIPFADLKAQYV